MDNQELYKEIDLIQSCINRMAKNSFMIKGWALTIFAGVITFSKMEAINNLWMLICTILVPYVAFWLLDAFFLHTERKYCKMYAWVIQERKRGNTEYQYDLNPERFKEDVGCMLCSFFSKTLLLFYGIPTIVIIALIVHLIYQSIWFASRELYV